MVSVSVQKSTGSNVALSIDRASSIPLHLQLFEQLRYFISIGRLTQGDPLPPVRRLASELELSMTTVVRALESLRVRGLVEARPRRGVYVADFSANLGTPSAATPVDVHDFAVHVSAEARGMGLDPLDVGLALRGMAANASPPVLTFVEAFPSVDSHVRWLQRTLADEIVEIVGVTLVEIQRRRSRAPAVARAQLIACAPYVYGLVRRALPDRTHDIVGVAMQLDPRVSEQLRLIDSRARVAIVATLSSFMGWMQYIVANHVLLESDPIVIAASDRRLRKLLSTVDTVVYGAGAAKRVLPLVPESARAIEVSHIPDERSVERLREAIRRRSVDALARRTRRESNGQPHRRWASIDGGLLGNPEAQGGRG